MKLPKIHVLRRVEASAIALATAGAASGLNSVKPAGIPLDRLGMWADIIAGGFALTHFLHHKRRRIRHALQLAGAAVSIDDRALEREAARQGRSRSTGGPFRYTPPSDTFLRSLEDCATND
jgi:hypothetical protein